METSPTPNPDPAVPGAGQAPRPAATPLAGAELLGAGSSSAPPPPPPFAPPSSWPPAPSSPSAPSAGAGVATPSRHSSRGSQQRLLGIIAAVFLLVGSAFVGFGARDGWFTRDTSSSSSAAPSAESSASSSNTSTGNTALGQVADTVDDAVVNITTSTSGGAAAGTGMIISSKGLVLTNHHVISGAEDLEVEVGGNGKTYDAHVVGYSLADDVAVVQIEGASGLPTIETDDSVSPDEEVLVMGNALGRGGQPTVSAGRVVALGQQITATDETGRNRETLVGMIQLEASVQPGQSGGAVVDADGEVVGMTTAASVNGGFRFGFEEGSTEAYAIPIARAIATAETISRGTSTDEIHVGPRGILGITISEGGATSSAGVRVTDVTNGGPADDAGISAGSTIVGIGEASVRTADDIPFALNRYAPGDRVKVTWLDTNGDSYSATLVLDEGPPA